MEERQLQKYDMPVVDSLHSEKYAFVHFMDSSNGFTLVQFGYHATPPGYGYGPIIRDHFLLHFVRQGSGIVQANDVEYKVGAGSIFAIYPHQITYYESSREDPWEYYWIGFGGRLAPEIMSRIGFEKDRTIAVRIRQPEAVFQCLESARALIAQQPMVDENLLAILARCLDALHIVSHVRQDAISPENREVPGHLGRESTRTLLSIINSSLSQRISVQELADKLNMNRTYMSELFRRDVGKSIREYISDARMGKALILLQDPDRPISAIAYQCGYEDALYFSRAFRKRYGLSPSQWRERGGDLSAPPEKE